MRSRRPAFFMRRAACATATHRRPARRNARHRAFGAGRSRRECL